MKNAILGSLLGLVMTTAACTNNSVGVSAPVMTPLEGDWQVTEMNASFGNEPRRDLKADEEGFIQFSEETPVRFSMLVNFRAYSFTTTMLNKPKSRKTSPPETREFEIQGDELVLKGDSQSRIKYTLQGESLTLSDPNGPAMKLRRIPALRVQQLVKEYGNFAPQKEVGLFEVSYQIIPEGGSGGDSTTAPEKKVITLKPDNYSKVGDVGASCVLSTKEANKKENILYISVTDPQLRINIGINGVTNDLAPISVGSGEESYLYVTIPQEENRQFSSYQPVKEQGPKCSGVLTRDEQMGLAGTITCKSVYGYSSPSGNSKKADIEIKMTNVNCSTY